MTTARLTFASTSHSADARYLAGMAVHDPFVGLVFKNKGYAVASSLELGNFLKNSTVDKVLSLDSLAKDLPATGTRLQRTARLIVAAAKKIGARKLEVGSDFPVGLFATIKPLMAITIAKGALFPERFCKQADEVQEITKANKACAAAISMVRDEIAAAKVVKGKLVAKGGKPLTSEALRQKVNEYFIAHDMVAVEDPIIAGGVQACDPHCNGFGQLKASQLIVVDIFAPRATSGYWGDMTRTFIKGQPTDAQAWLVEAVASAQDLAIEMIEPGVKAGAVHAAVEEFFDGIGYKTYCGPKGYEGFFHGTGHGLGLDCHDLTDAGASLGKNQEHKLQVDEVYTVEPGLYYPEIGGCRIEDNGIVTEKRFKLLSKMDYWWIL